MSKQPNRTLRLDTDRAVQELMAKAAARISGNVAIRVRHNEVCVTGVAYSWHEKQLVQESLREVSRSYRIRNDIAVSAWG